MAQQAGGEKRERWLPPRGRHRLPPEVIAGSQRERLLDAAVRVAAEKGYGTMTLTDLTREAGVSRSTFYELFEDKQDCFLAAYDRGAGALVRRLTAAFEAEEGWPRRVRAGLGVLLEALAEDPDVARMALVDFGAAGPAAQRRQRAVLQRLTPLFDEGRDYAPGGRNLPANTSRMAIGAVAGLIGDALAEERAEDLPNLLSDVLFATLMPYIGPAAAAREVGETSR